MSIDYSEKMAAMREGGLILNAAIRKVADSILTGISTEELNKIAEDFIRKAGALPAFLGYKGYPKSVCISINDEVVHGIPAMSRFIKNGDAVGIDLGVKYKRFYTDKAMTVGVGKIPANALKLIDVTRQALEIGLEVCRNWQGLKISDISRAIQEYVEENKFSIVRDLSGHGIGRELHEDPRVPNFTSKKFPEVDLYEGMTLAIEPMVIAGDWKVKTLADGWTIVSADGSPAAHFEDTIILTEKGSEILTR
ncbi:MAG: type I methionyl aminopeptidase [Patescibacteria group bacterium]